MELSNTGYCGSHHHLESLDTFPTLLREKIQTYAGNYLKNNKKIPNLIILSEKVTEILHNARLLFVPSSFSDIQNRDSLELNGLRLEVYQRCELPTNKREPLEKMLSGNPWVIYLGRTNWWGLGSKIKGSSLKEYNLLF